MASISDIIENFILKTLGESDSIEISRNDLAEFFSCAPSQINYVLETRFTVDRGYARESKRGGSGFIKITKVNIDDDNYVRKLVLESIGDELKENRMGHILDKLTEEKILSKAEADIVKTCLSDDNLIVPNMLRDKIRAKSFKGVLVNLLKNGEDSSDDTIR